MERRKRGEQEMELILFFVFFFFSLFLENPFCLSSSFSSFFFLLLILNCGNFQEPLCQRGKRRGVDGFKAPSRLVRERRHKQDCLLLLVSMGRLESWEEKEDGRVRNGSACESISFGRLPAAA